jgi:hypothetical protein
MPFYLTLVAEVCFAVGDRARAGRLLEEARKQGDRLAELRVSPDLAHVWADRAPAGS